MGRMTKLALVCAIAFAGKMGYDWLSRPASPRGLGETAMLARDYETARVHFERAVMEDPDDMRSHADLAACCWELGDRDGALRHYRAAEPYLDAQGMSVTAQRHRERLARLKALRD